MSAWDAMQEQQFFRASSHDYPIGTVLDPSEQHHLHHEDSDPGQHTSLIAPNQLHASAGTYIRWNRWARKHKDSDFPRGVDIAGKSFKTFAPVRIVGKVDRDE